MKKYQVITNTNNYIFYADRKSGNKYSITFYNVRLSKSGEKHYNKWTFYKRSPFTVKEI